MSIMVQWLAFTALGAALSGDVAGAAAQFAAAKRALENQAPDEALAKLDGLETKLPEGVDYIWAAQAAAYRLRGEWSRALARWQRVLSTTPDSPVQQAARYGAADAYYALGDNQQAARAYEAALARFPSAPPAHIAQFNLGRLAHKRGDWRTAGTAYSALYHRRPTGPLSDVAGQHLQELVAGGKLPPPTVATRLGRVDRLLSAGEMERARTEIAALASEQLSKRDSAALLYRRAHLAYRLRDFDHAVELFTQLKEARPTWSRLTYERWIARCYSTAGRYEEARDTYLAIAARYASGYDGRDALFKAAWLAYNERRHAEAIDLFTQYLRRYPTDRVADEAQWYLAWNHFLSGDLAHASEQMSTLVTSYPRSQLRQRGLYWQGRIRAALGDIAGARNAYVATREDTPRTYYAVLATQRLDDLPSSGEPIVFAPGMTLLASLDVPAIPATDPSNDKGEAETAEGDTSAKTPAEPPDPPAFHWNTPVARRLVTLAAMGEEDAAAGLVSGLTPTGRISGQALSVARARLLASLGAYNEAYEIASRYVEDNVEDKIGAQATDPALLALAYPLAHAPLVHAAAREFGVSPALILAVMRQESGFRHRAQSWAGARGLMQIISRTGSRIASELSVSPFDATLLDDPEINIRFGTWYLGKLLDKYYGHVALAVGSYNAGPIAVASWLESRPGMATDVFVEEIPYRETRHYVKRVLGNLGVYSRLQLDAELRLPLTVPPAHLNNVDF